MATVNRVREYQQRRAVALNYEEHVHDLAIETRFRKIHGHVARGPKAMWVRKVLTDFAFRAAERNTQ